MAPIIFSPVSEKDIEDQYVFIALKNKPSAKKFLESIQKITETLSNMPKIGTVFPVEKEILLEIRFLSISRFSNHLIFYGLSDKNVRILRILHTKRDLDNIQI